MSTASNYLRAGMVLGLLVLGVGCDEDSLSPYPYGTIEGQLVKVENGEPADSLEVSLVDLPRLMTVATTNSDANGRFEFRRVEPGEYVPVVRANTRRTYFLPHARWSLAARDTVRITIPVAPVVFNPDGDFVFHGRVVDADTLEPVPFARVEMNDPSLYNPFGMIDGRASTLEPVSDQDGFFDLGPMPVFFREDGTQITTSWRVSHPDYLDRSFPPFEDYAFPDSLRVLLTRGIDAHAVVGRVVDRDRVPVEGVAVGVDWRRGLNEPFKASPKVVTGPVGAAITDASGRYRIEALPTGWFNVRCGLFNDDGWLDSERLGIQITVGSDSTEVEDLIVLPAIVPVSPQDYETVGTRPFVEWESVPGASRYDLTFQRAATGAIRGVRTEQTSFATASDGFFQSPGLYLWSVEAVDSEFGLIAGSERPHSWVYEPAAVPGAKP